VNPQGAKEMRTKEEIRKWLELLEKEQKGPFTERENIAQKSHKAGFTMGIRRS